MGVAYPGYRKQWFQMENKDGIKAVKVLTYITANEGFFKRTWNYVFYMMMTVLVAPRLGKADVVVSTSPQFFNGLAGYFVSRLKRCPWVLEIRDLWPESIVAVGAITNRRAVALLEAAERFAYRKADHIVCVTNAFQRHISARGGREESISVIRNGVDFESFAHQKNDVAFARKIGVEGKFVAAYVGTHGMAHGLDTLLAAAEILSSREDIVFVMAGDGADRVRLESEIEKKKLNNVKMLGQLPKDEMPRLWSCSDVGLVLLRKLDLFLSVVPSKIFETMAMKKPIILGVRGESQVLIEESGAGICVEPENAAQLASAIVDLCDDPTRADALGESGYRYAKAHFDRRALARTFEQVLVEVL